MKRCGTLFGLAIGLLAMWARPAPACTMIMAAKNGVVLAGNNEDWRNPKTRYTIVPAESGRFGCIHFGFDDGSPQGGMNDRGLFIDGNAVAPTGWKADRSKASLSRNPMLEILQTCATVGDVRAFFEKHNVFALSRARFPVADRDGRSMVVEYAQGQIRFVTEPEWFQVSTNFLRTDHPGTEVPCNRFRTAMKILAASDRLDLSLIRAALSAVHQEGDYPTQYSNIYDLKAGLVHVYLFHNFEEGVTLDLAEQLKKGARSVELASLFKVIPHAAIAFIDQQTQPSYPVLLETYEAEGAEAAVARYENMRRQVRWVSRYDIGENQVLRMTVFLMDKGEPRAALSMSRALAASFPDSWRAHEAVGRAHLALGQAAEAIAAYRRVLEINPGNASAKAALKDLEKKK
ncbi:MAG: tetratricopeptide repeat protein [Candidatus Aminicenantes bacterium]|nr:tetratricopeptide repeat protein [Candidatus Aminicenantes bacterium]